MKRAYLILLALAGAGTLVAMTPNIALVASIYSLGLLAPVLLILPNAFFVLLCLAPLMFLGRRFLVSVPLSAALVTAFFLAPGVLSDRMAGDILSEQISADVRSPQALKGHRLTGVELQRPAKLNSNMWHTTLGHDMCGAFCRRLLHGGQVDWIRIKLTDQNAGSDTVTVVRGTSEGCSEQQCFEFVENTGLTPDAVIQVEEDYQGPYDANRNPRGWAQYQGQRKMTVSLGQQVVWRQTEVHLFVINGPQGLRPALHGLVSGGNKGGLSYHRSRAVRNAIDPAAVMASLGVTLAAELPAEEAPRRRNKRSAPKLPTAASRAEVASLLDQSGEITQPMLDKIGQWLVVARAAPDLAPEDVALVMRIAEDVRIDRAFALDHVLTRQPAVRAEMIPWFFDRMEKRDLPKSRFLEQISSDFRHMPAAPEELEPYAERFVAIVEERRYHTPLLASAGRFGFDPTPMLRAAYKPGEKSRYLVMSGVCKSDPKWFPTLLPFVRGVIADEMVAKPGRRLDGVIEDGLKFLAHMGHTDEARAIVESSDWSDKDFHLTRGFVSPNARSISANRIC